MTSYKPTKLWRGQVFALTLRALASLLEQWFLILAVVFFLSPVGPHLRITYSPHSCDYLGSRGFIRVMGDRCPLVDIFDSREYGRP